jgi:hypothetical protein
MANLSLQQIATGWYNFIVGDPSTKLMIQTRLSVCDGCDQKVQLSELGKVIIQHINQEASVYKCKLCTCPLSTKVAAPKSVCPHPQKKWGEWKDEQSYW